MEQTKDVIWIIITVILMSFVSYKIADFLEEKDFEAEERWNIYAGSR